jgi:hypothetical protein
MNAHPTNEQRDFLLENLEVMEILAEIRHSDRYVEVFGESSLDDVLELYETIDNTDPALRERYQRLQAELVSTDQHTMLEKLRQPSPFGLDGDSD